MAQFSSPFANWLDPPASTGSGSGGPIEAETFAANCLAGDAIGNCVYVSGADVAGVTQVTTCDTADKSTFPAIGIIASKSTATDCVVQVAGTMTIFAGLTAGAKQFVSAAGSLVATAPTPGVGQLAVVQIMGVAFQDDIFFLQKFLPYVRRG